MVVPSASVTCSLSASATTWLLVRMRPLSSIMKPVPVPWGWGSERKPGGTTELITVTADGRTSWYTRMTVSEEAPPWTGGDAWADDAPPEATPVAPPPATPALPTPWAGAWAAAVLADADCVGCAGAWAAGALVAAAVG